MNATKSGDLANTSWDGDTEKTAITNAAAGQPGYPAETITGETVFIVKKKQNGQDGQTLVDDAGNEYRDNGYGKLVEVDEIQPDEDLGDRINESVDAAETAEAKKLLAEKVAAGELTPEEAAELERRIVAGDIGAVTPDASWAEEQEETPAA